MKSFTFMRVRLKNTFMKNELHAHKECIINFMAPMYMNFKDTVCSNLTARFFFMCWSTEDLRLAVKRRERGANGERGACENQS